MGWDFEIFHDDFPLFNFHSTLRGIALRTMASSGQYARIHEAFSQDVNLRKRIFDTIGTSTRTIVDLL
jgi:hypothetical protein